MKNAVYLLEADFLFKLVGNAKIFVLERSGEEPQVQVFARS